MFLHCFKCSTQNRLRSHFPYGVILFPRPALCSGISTPSHLLPSVFSLQTGQFIFLFHIISWLCVAAQSCLLSSTAILGIWHFISAVFSFIWASKGPMSLQWWVSLLFTSLDRSTSCFVFLNIFLRWICLHAAQRVELLPEPLRLHKTVEEKYIKKESQGGDVQ